MPKSVRDLPRIHDPERLAAVEATGLLDTDPESPFDELVTLAAQLVNAPFAFMTVVDSHRSFWKAHLGTDPAGPRQNTVEESFCQYVIASGEPLVAGDVSASPLTAANPSIKSMGVRAWAGFPLISPQGQPLGSFCVVDTSVRVWSDRDVETLRVLSQAAGREIALRAALARAAVSGRQLQLLAEASHLLSSTRNADDAVAALPELLVPTLGDWSVVAVGDTPDELTDVGWCHAAESMRPVLDEFVKHRLIGLDGTGTMTAVHRGGQPIVLQSGATEAGLAILVSEQAREAYRQLNPNSYGVWPLAFGGTVHGVLLIGRDQGRLPFAPAELELADDIAGRAGTLLDNARLYQQQQRVSDALEIANARLRDANRHDRVVSRALQNAMLTPLPKPDHLQVTARYITADLHDQVGGDWYDALVLPSGATLLTVGDVAGHQIAAAAEMGQLRNLCRVLAWDHDDESPAALIARLDRTMPGFGLTTMTTLIVARLDPPADDTKDGLRTLTWCSAGHPTPVLLDAQGRPQLVRTRADPPLGVGHGLPRHDHVTEIGPGQTLLLFTDGLVETRTESVDDRLQQLLEVLESLAGGELDETMDSLLTAMVGDAPEDDVALLAVRVSDDFRMRTASRATR
jgi:serine phosphatase RsbU (regulator of sigma subunit)